MSQSSTPTVDSATNQSRRIAVRALLILVAITVALAAVTAVYLFTRPSYAGTWVGPGNVQGTGEPHAVVASLSLEQNLLGGISGTGKVCAATGSALTQIPVNVDGNLSGSSASLTLHTSGGGASILPASLLVQGALSQGQLTLSAGEPAFMLLTMQHGSANDFTAACQQLTQPASG
jgi:hypothetical protein